MVMIVLLVDSLGFLNLRFESDVISDGTQAIFIKSRWIISFESDVISDGTQASTFKRTLCFVFESDVISDGTQADGRDIIEKSTV